MRTSSISTTILAAITASCGPIYPDPPQPQQPAPQPAATARGDDPWAEPVEVLRPSARGRGAPANPDPVPADPYDTTEPAGRAAGPAPPPEARAPEPRPSGPEPRPRAQPGSGTVQALVDAHNRVRAQHCAAPLAWSPQLADAAQKWANELRDRGCRFGHSGGRYGENLAAGTSGTLDPDAIVTMWYDEVRDYSFASGGFSMRTGHFTQVVWRDTARLGCAMTQCNGNDIWVCEYDPPGNVQGMYRDNVKPKGCR